MLIIRANGACAYKYDRWGAIRAYKEPVDKELFNSLEKRCEADFPEGESAPSPRDTHFPQESDSRS